MNAWIVSHSHWDREWYLPFESHRYYFVQLMDQVINLLETDKDFHSFHLDGQTILLEDYLKVRPDQERRVKDLLVSEKLVVGPWYVLQDAYLTSPEANVRNLLYGIEISRSYQQQSFVGYFPDTFGIYGQAPQILKLCNITTAAFGRGVTPTGFNNTVQDDPFSSTFSELRWEAPDGSSVLGILFANWYSNGNEMPRGTEAQVQAYWDSRVKRANQFSASGELLFMNGCDHQPVQADASLAIQKANDYFGKAAGVKFEQTSLIGYAQKLYETLPGNLDLITGELVNQRTDGWSTLVNTASSRMRLKQYNALCQRQLEREIEPLVLYLGGQEAHKAYVTFLWKSLMENHPHDSICGCSIDAVHREMASRFERLKAAIDTFKQDMLSSISMPYKTQEEGLPIVVVHTATNQEARLVEACGFLDKHYFRDQNFSTIPDALIAMPKRAYRLVNDQGDLIPCEVVVADWDFGYDLPKDGFRLPFYGRAFKVNFVYKPCSSPEIALFYLKPVEEPILQGLLEQEAMASTCENSIENEFIRVTVHPDRTFEIFDKSANETLAGLGEIISEGDIGNAYMFRPSADGMVISSKDDAHCRNIPETKPLIKQWSQFEQSLALNYVMNIPASADSKLLEEQKRLVWLPERRSCRSMALVPVQVKVTLKLKSVSKHLDIQVQIDNSAKDHRMRMLFEHPEALAHHYAQSVFEIVKRDNQPAKQWQHPNFDQRMQGYMSFGESLGITIATEGLHEYEIIENKVVAITLLRATGEMGDWGYFPTPEGQEQGVFTLNLAINSHRGNLLDSKAYQWAENCFDQTLCYVANNKVYVNQEGLIAQPDASKGQYPWHSDLAVVTAIKAPQRGQGILMRCYNPLNQPISIVLTPITNHRLLQVNLLEEPIAQLASMAASTKCSKVTHWLKPYEIATFLWQPED